MDLAILGEIVKSPAFALGAWSFTVVAFFDFLIKPVLKMVLSGWGKKGRGVLYPWIVAGFSVATGYYNTIYGQKITAFMPLDCALVFLFSTLIYVMGWKGIYKISFINRIFK